MEKSYATEAKTQLDLRPTHRYVFEPGLGSGSFDLPKIGVFIGVDYDRFATFRGRDFRCYDVDLYQVGTGELIIRPATKFDERLIANLIKPPQVVREELIRVIKRCEVKAVRALREDTDMSEFESPFYQKVLEKLNWRVEKS